MKKHAKKPPSARHAGLKLLGGSDTRVPRSPQASVLESFKNKNPQRDYWIHFDCPEFTSICPVTGQPDFGTITISYVPEALCVESKSLKFYLFSYRNRGAFNEDIVNRILNDLVKAVSPRKATVRGVFTARGGISITVEASHP